MLLTFLQYAVIVTIIIIMVISGGIAGYVKRDDVSCIFNVITIWCMHVLYCGYITQNIYIFVFICKLMYFILP